MFRCRHVYGCGRGIALGLAFFVLFGIVPTIANLVISFTDYSGLAGTPTSFTGFSNYSQLFTSSTGFTSSIIDTLIFVVGVTVVQNVIGLALAHRLVDDTKTASGLSWRFSDRSGGNGHRHSLVSSFDPFSSPAASVSGLFDIHPGFFGGIVGPCLWSSRSRCGKTWALPWQCTSER